MADPALIAAVAGHTGPSWRAGGWGTRSWCDFGYAAGAVIAGLAAGALGLSAAVVAGGRPPYAPALPAARWIAGNRSL